MAAVFLASQGEIVCTLMRAALVFFLASRRWSHPFMALGHLPALIRAWFDHAADARQAKAATTHRAGVRA